MAEQEYELFAIRYATRDARRSDHFIGGATGMPAVAGTPSVTVPSGETKGLPPGLTFMGRAYSEGELIGFGHRIVPVRVMTGMTR